MISGSSLAVQSPYFSNVVASKLMVSVCFSLRGTMTSFVDTIPDVVSVGSEEQVLRVHTGRVVTSMQDAEAPRRGSVSNLPRDAMRRQEFSIHA